MLFELHISWFWYKNETIYNIMTNPFLVIGVAFLFLEFN